MKKLSLAAPCAVAAFIALSWSPVMAQEACRNIENDIERLDCYDRAFSDNSRSGNMAPVQKFEEFSRLVASEYIHGDNGYDLVGASFHEETCEVALLNYYYDDDYVDPFNAGAGYQTGTRIFIDFFDVADVQELIRAEDRAVDIIMRRGETVSTYRGFNGNLESRDAIRAAFNDMLEAFENDTVPSRLLAEFVRVFSHEVTIATRQSEMDSDAIVNALWDLHEACDAAD